MNNNTPFSEIPHLEAELRAPLSGFVADISAQADAIESWLAQQGQRTPPLFYGSVDLRYAGFKLAPVDTNLFPAGFNNLDKESYPGAKTAILHFLAAQPHAVSTVLLIAESHSRNLFYFENLVALQKILQQADLTVRIGSWSDELHETKNIELASGASIQLEPITRKENQLVLEDFIPDLLVLNNDLSDGIPTLLQNLSQTIVPNPQLGWSSRLKSSHFQHYANVCSEFATQFSFDPWALAPLYRYCGEVNFLTRQGEECLYRHAKTLFEAIQAKYREYNIDHDPFLVIKADAGTYGMAVMMVKDPEEILQLNRKGRTKMAKGKGGKSVSRAFIQEGVHTFERWNDMACEPVIYGINGEVIGGFYRVHESRGVDQNLNAPGMRFEPLRCMHKSDPTAQRCYAYSVVARLAMLAAARENVEVQYDG